MDLTKEVEVLRERPLLRNWGRKLGEKERGMFISQSRAGYQSTYR